MRRAAKRDASEKDIVAALRNAGASVYLMDRPCDSIVGFSGVNHLVEFKTPDTRYGEWLNENQQEFNGSWRGSPIIILRTPDDAIAFVNALRRAA